MIKKGVWTIKSNEDERWNKKGKGKDDFTKIDLCPEAKKWIEECEVKYGNTPKDIGYEFIF